MSTRTLLIVGVLVCSPLLIAQDSCCDEGMDEDFDTYCANVNDCDDTDPLVHPDAPELCDGKDNDCDGILLPDGEDDADGDGVLACAECDDTNPSTYPGAPEICDGFDNDCDGEVPTEEVDADQDGHYACGDDCDDSDPNTYLGADELCDGKDNDCDGFVETGGEDLDQDGYYSCGEEADCDDTNSQVYPGAEELCDGQDQDCDGIPDVENGSHGEWGRSACGAVITPQGDVDSLGEDQSCIYYDEANGRYQIWYRMIIESTYAHAIGYATSTDGISWSRHSGPVLEPGDEGDWDAIRLGFPSVIYHEGQYMMWYHGNETSTKILIGLATSQDGETWNKSAANPVLRVGEPGSWDQSTVHAPSVMYDDEEGIYKMWYSGSGGDLLRVGYATSPDGEVWEKYPTWVMNVGLTGEWDDKRDVFARVYKYDGMYRMWYAGDDQSNTFTYDIGYAYSSDGINWTKDPNNPVFSPDYSGSPDSFDSFMVYAPDVIPFGDGYLMYYSGATSLSGPMVIGVAYNDSPF